MKGPEDKGIKFIALYDAITLPIPELMLELKPCTL